jgi:hypothetical protein
VAAHPSAFKTPDGEAKFVAAYDTALKRWPVTYEIVDARVLDFLKKERGDDEANRAERPAAQCGPAP